MNPALVVKLRPVGPWRSGPDSGARNRVDPVYHSDSLFSAVTAAMARLGMMDEWLDATARNAEAPAVCFSSCFPFLEDIGFIIPPRTIWPPASAAASPRVRWKSARFIPLGVVAALFGGQVLDENHWSVDGVSECLLPAGRPGPFRTSVRTGAAVDRMSGALERHSAACIEFRPDAGLWTLVSFADAAAHERWSGPIRAAFRLLADSGFGGERSRGWGHCEAPEFVDGQLPEMILPADAATRGRGDAATEEPAPPPTEGAEAPEDKTLAPGPRPPAPETAPGPRPPAPEPAHWLLSLFAPAPADSIDWQRGNYTVAARGGRIESPVRSGELKKQLRMVSEGSVLVGGETLRGSAPDVAPDGFPHPVYRAGFALSIPVPAQVMS